MSETSPLILPSPEIWHRGDFAVLCNWRLLWRAVEVGVDRAEWACVFLDRWMGNDYFGVDPYLPYPEMPLSREADFLVASQRLSRYGDRARLLRERSVDAASCTYFRDHPVDFVYLDGSHTYEAVRADLEVWWPVLSDRGIMSGHDWTDQPIHAGVKMAVTEFAGQHGLTIYITTVEGYLPETCPSWYLYKAGMPGSDWRRC